MRGFAIAGVVPLVGLKRCFNVTDFELFCQILF